MAESVIGALSVKITVDADGVKKGVKAASNALAIGSKQLRKSVNDYGKWAIAAVAAVTAVQLAIVKSNLAAIRELKNTSVAANTLVADFQRGAFAAEQFGISTEKYGDILKDVNDRIGDFLITGAGPMVDFFEQIAPKVGITADAFKNLSGQQSLALYIKTLEDANVSQNEMTFFMEALASDSIRLAPLFANNARAFSRLTAEAKSLGIGLSELDVTKAELASESLAKAGGLLDAMSKQATIELAPIIGSIADLFVDMANSAGGASSFIKSAISGVISVVGLFANGLRGIEIIFKTLEVAAIGFSALAVSVFQAVTNIIATSIDGWIMLVNEAVKAINNIFDTGINEIPTVRSSKFVKGVNEVGDNMRNLVSKTNNELDILAQKELPSEQIKNFADAAVFEFERVAKARTESEQGDAAGAGGKGVGTKKQSELEVFDAETIGLLEALSLRFQSQEEITLAHLEREREMINANFEAGRLNAKEHSDALISIRQQEEDTKRQITVNSVQAGFKALASNSKKVQKAMVVAAKIQAAIKGKQAAVDAFQAGMSIGGPWAPLFAASYAAASLINTASMIKGIGGSGKGSAPSGGIPSVSTPSSSPVGGGQGGQQQPDRNISINLQGSALFSTDQVRELIEQINEATGDGVQLNFVGEQ